MAGQRRNDQARDLDAVRTDVPDRSIAADRGDADAQADGIVPDDTTQMDGSVPEDEPGQTVDREVDGYSQAAREAAISESDASRGSEPADDVSEPSRAKSFFAKRKIPLAIAGVLVVVLVAMHVGVVPNPAYLLRDAGGFAGGTSYGGGGGGYGGGYGGGSTFYVIGGSSSSDDIGELSVIDIVFAIIILSILFFPYGKGSSRRESERQPEGATRTPESKLRPLSELVGRDPAFSSADVEDLISNVYVRMQNAWTAGDFEPMRPYFSNALFSQFANQLAALRAVGRTNYVDNIAVLESTVRGWYESRGNEYLVMKVRTRITDYTLDDKTGALVGGYRDKESFMEYEYTLSRSAGTKTVGQGTQTKAGECPNCGAPLNIAQNARCEYCGTVVESREFTWVISAIKGISQQIR